MLSNRRFDVHLSSEFFRSQHWPNGNICRFLKMVDLAGTNWCFIMRDSSLGHLEGHSSQTLLTSAHIIGWADFHSYDFDVTWLGCAQLATKLWIWRKPWAVGLSLGILTFMMQLAIFETFLENSWTTNCSATVQLSDKFIDSLWMLHQLGTTRIIAPPCVRRCTARGTASADRLDK